MMKSKTGIMIYHKNFVTELIRMYGNKPSDLAKEVERITYLTIKRLNNIGADFYDIKPDTRDLHTDNKRTT